MLHKKFPPYRTSLAALTLGISACCLQAQTPLTVTLNPSSLGRTIPSDFLGMSFEMFTAVNVGTTDYPTSNPPTNNPATAWFNSANSPLGNVLQRLGVKNVRIGGTSAEEPTFYDKNAAYPAQYDAAYASDFVQQYGMEMIWNLPVAANYNLTTYGTFAEQMVAAQRNAGQNFPMVFEIGNEPDAQNVGTANYTSRFDAYTSFLRSGIGTSVQVLGPSSGANTYSAALLADPNYNSSTALYHGNVADITQHLYPFGSAAKVSSLNAAITMMLTDNSTTYGNDYNSWGPAAMSDGYNTRYDEMNSFSHGGYNGASNSFAAALWGLDIMEYYSHHTTLSGLNFHEGVTGAYYSPFTPESLSSSYNVQGLGYGMLAFSTDGIGQIVPETRSNTSLDVTAYGTLLSNGTETAIIINQTNTIAGNATAVSLTIVPGKSYKTANVYYLRAPNDDPTQTTGITFGGGRITGTGAWGGGAEKFTVDANGNFDIPLPATEAAVINMTN